ncbi:MAG: diguanylate cyclase, partial [Candidatus Omnitrophica bacterium]|nr:diguanylate cyclase [Candidatus Omnitrophota bacterium]
ENKKVLLAEHQKSILDILVYLLKAWDYEVITATKGASVLEIVRQQQPDIIIIDYTLPGIDGLIDGLEVSKALKEDFLTAHIPVIILIDKKHMRKKMLEIEQGVDDYIANPPDPIDLEVRLEMALRRTAYQLHANALTKLPGNRRIEKVIQTKIEQGLDFSVAYYDIDNFKSFNDKYGYMKGDNLIRHTAYIISTIVKRYGNKDDFVGHIGGDDFVVVTTPENEGIIASESISNFNRLAQFHYSIEDRQRGYIIVKDRRGNLLNTPLVSISIAIVNNKESKAQSIVEIMEIVNEVKRYLKTLPGSNFLINRRVSAKREKEDLDQKVSVEQKSVTKSTRGVKYKPLGQILLESQVLSPQQLEVALSKHWSTGQKIGTSIMDLGMASAGDIARALELQLDIPHFDLRKLKSDKELKELIRMIPLDVMKDHHIIPVDKEKNVISLVMLDPKDFKAIDKVRSLNNGCSIVTFFVLENEFKEIWERTIKENPDIIQKEKQNIG